eukprot:6480358-Pyramimonas_sp.AAC.1
MVDVRARPEKCVMTKSAVPTAALMLPPESTKLLFFSEGEVARKKEGPADPRSVGQDPHCPCRGAAW